MRELRSKKWRGMQGTSEHNQVPKVQRSANNTGFHALFFKLWTD